MSTGHVLLGLLAEGERHGYELKREHDARFPAARPLAFGQVYATLERLRNRGLVDTAASVKADGPERTPYALTDAGRAELDRWLAEVEAPSPYVANPLSVKVDARAADRRRGARAGLPAPPARRAPAAHARVHPPEERPGQLARSRCSPPTTP